MATQHKARSEQAQCAAMIRRELKLHYPHTTFRVTSKGYSMGDHVSIHWADGPSDAPDRIRLTLNLTGPQVITLRAALAECTDRAAAKREWSKVSHLDALSATIQRAAKQ
jgi:hypothetical protein